MQVFIVIILLCLSVSRTDAQENRTLEFFPAGRHFMPLRANVYEPNIGVLYFTDNQNLKVDIGYSTDVLGYRINKKTKITLGIDFFAYALSTSFQGKRLQIDALDGFFGGDITLSKNYNQHSMFLRFRIIHNSAHFVDGHYDSISEEWKDGIKPIPFTKDFGEITLLDEVNFYGYDFRLYSSVAYSTLIRPQTIKRYFYNFGFETAKVISKSILGKEAMVYFSFHSNLIGSPKYSFTNNYKLGLKFGGMNERGLLIYLMYYDGNNMFSEYYYEKVSRFGIGFNVEFL